MILVTRWGDTKLNYLGQAAQMLGESFRVKPVAAFDCHPIFELPPAFA